MTDREKVIRGLECCERPYEKKCDACPYIFHAPDSMECTAYLCKDALELLTEQEAVVGDRDELLKALREAHKACLNAMQMLAEQETEYKPDGPDFTDGRMYTRWKCTSCQYFVCTEKGTPGMKYCPNCGRRVKWDAD